MTQRNFFILLVMVAVSYVCHVRSGPTPYSRYVASGFAAIDGAAMEEVPNRELYEGAMRGMVDVLHRRGDVHSEFLPEDEAESIRADIRQQFGGIGVRIRFVDKPPRLVIVGPPEPRTPAARANLLPGDQIAAIDDQPTAPMNMGEVLRRMRGRPGTVVTLTIAPVHTSDTRTVALTREVIVTESILGDTHDRDGKWQFALPNDPRIALVRVTTFGDRTADELLHVLEQQTSQGVEAVVLDLRDNSGGVLDAAVAVCGLFLPGGKLVVELRGRGHPPDRRHTVDVGAKFLALPLAVLVNHNSASAAEIVAACLQDHGRAVIVGERTYGKGTVQRMLEMESGRSLLKLTTAGFWRPSGANIHRPPEASESARWGVSPDAGYEVRLAPDEYAVYRLWRAERDMGGRISEEEIQQTSESDDPPVPEDYVDAQLEKAADYLRDELHRKQEIVEVPSDHSGD
jgi:carboxyl-terminal processing protease